MKCIDVSLKLTKGYISFVPKHHMMPSSHESYLLIKILLLLFKLYIASPVEQRWKCNCSSENVFSIGHVIKNRYFQQWRNCSLAVNNRYYTYVIVPFDKMKCYCTVVVLMSKSQKFALMSLFHRRSDMYNITILMYIL
jgi:hypothetical protein